MTKELNNFKADLSEYFPKYKNLINSDKIDKPLEELRQIEQELSKKTGYDKGKAKVEFSKNLEYIAFKQGLSEGFPKYQELINSGKIDKEIKELMTYEKELMNNAIKNSTNLEAAVNESNILIEVSFNSVIRDHLYEKRAEEIAKLTKESYKPTTTHEQESTRLANSKNLMLDTKEQPSNPTTPRNISPTSVSQQR